MTPIFCNSHLNLEKGTRGVYKLIINNQWFYIGSSVDLKRRLSVWKHHLKRGCYRKNYLINNLISNIKEVKFEILEKVASDLNPKLLEDYYVKLYFKDENCLNLIPGALTLKGRRGKVENKIKKGSPTKRKRVAQYNMAGSLMKIFPSIKAASKETGVLEDRIRAMIAGKPVNPRGCYFKQIGDDGKPISNIVLNSLVSFEMVKFIVDNYNKLGNAEISRRTGLSSSYIRLVARGKAKKHIIYERLVGGRVPCAKAVKEVSYTGEEIQRFPSIGSAARAFNIKMSHIQRVLNGSAKQTHGKYFKYV